MPLQPDDVSAAPLVPLSAAPRPSTPSAAERPASSPALAPRGVGEILDHALELLRADFFLLIGAALVLWFPVRLLVSVLAVGTPLSDMEDLQALLRFIGGSFVSSAAMGLANLLAISFVALAVYASLHGERPPAGRLFKIALRRLPILFLITIAVALLTGGGMLLCFVPGLLVAWKLSLANVTPLLEDTGFSASFSRSSALTRASFWRWFGLYSLQGVLTSPLTAIVALPYEPTVRQELFAWSGLSTFSFEAIFVPLTTLFQAVVSAYAGVVFCLYYVDQRVRREGFDLELRARRSGTPGEPGAQSPRFLEGATS